ncbi:hypothetical protein MTO96_001593 [Rhipicephalus appendiculatus]
MSSEEDSAAEGQLSFARAAKAKRNTSRLPRVDAGEARVVVAPPSNGTSSSLDLRSPPSSAAQWLHERRRAPGAAPG